MEHRVFGAPRPGVAYRDRPAAYGIAFDRRGRAAVVCCGEYGCFLLGGGMEPGEEFCRTTYLEYQSWSMERAWELHKKRQKET